MSTLSVNTIKPTSGNNLILSGSNIAIPGDLTVTGNIIGNISGSTTIGGILTVDQATGTATIVGSLIVSGGNTLHNVGAMTTGFGCFVASGSDAMAQGISTVATGTGSHAEGGASSAQGRNSHAEGGYFYYNPTLDQWVSAIAGGIAYGMGSHAEGSSTNANGLGSHTEGAGTAANGEFSHAEGGYAT